MPIYYNKCWKWPPLRSSHRCTRRIMLTNTFCNVPVDILSTVNWMLAWSSCSVCGWFEYTVSLRCPHKEKSGGLKSGDRGCHNLFEMRRPENRFQVSHGFCDFLNTLYIITEYHNSIRYLYESYDHPKCDTLYTAHAVDACSFSPLWQLFK
jgi:hypothetical protein